MGVYTLLCPLSRGGMGVVWAAALTTGASFTKVVALKTILSDLVEDPEYARALRDEAQLAASIAHPNLCDVTDLGQADGFPYLVMEWVDGGSVAELLGEGGERGLEPLVATRIVADACAGLHALHEARDPMGQPLGAVHRDVSPHNLLISRQGQVKVSDLGVAKARGQWRARTRSGELRGKLGYLAPEQLGKGRLDRRCDVHALGCVLYQCLSGSLPYPASTAAFEKVLKGEYVRVEVLRPDVPPALASIVARALAPDPAARFESAHALREALEEWRATQWIDHDRSTVQRCLEERLGAVMDRRHRSIRRAFDRYGPQREDGDALPAG